MFAVNISDNTVLQLYLPSAPGRDVLTSPGLLNAEFNRFQAAQGRNYGPGELRYRLRVFRDNLKSVVECNERHGSYTCEENKVRRGRDGVQSAIRVRKKPAFSRKVRSGGLNLV